MCPLRPICEGEDVLKFCHVIASSTNLGRTTVSNEECNLCTTNFNVWLVLLMFVYTRRMYNMHNVSGFRSKMRCRYMMNYCKT